MHSYSVAEEYLLHLEIFLGCPQMSAIQVAAVGRNCHRTLGPIGDCRIKVEALAPWTPVRKPFCDSTLLTRRYANPIDY